jgi:hypothetical protein
MSICCLCLCLSVCRLPFRFLPLYAFGVIPRVMTSPCCLCACRSRSQHGQSFLRASPDVWRRVRIPPP